MKAKVSMPSKPKAARKKQQLQGKAAATVAATKTVDLLAADVLLGRGKRASQYEGNRRYYKMVACYLPAYKRTSKNREKSKITQEILERVQQQGGRFLKEAGDQFVPVSDQVARTKIGQALRHQLRLQEGGGAGDEDNGESTRTLTESERELRIVSHTSLSYRSAEELCSSRSFQEFSARSERFPVLPAQNIVSAPWLQNSTVESKDSSIRTGSLAKVAPTQVIKAQGSEPTKKDSDLFSSVSDMGLQDDMDEFEAISEIDEEENAHEYQLLDADDETPQRTLSSANPHLLVPSAALSSQPCKPDLLQSKPPRRISSNQGNGGHDDIARSQLPQLKPVPKGPAAAAAASIIDDKDLEGIDFGGLGADLSSTLPVQQSFWTLTQPPSAV